MQKTLLLDAGSGGRASQRLISDLFARHFSNDILNVMDDAALLNIDGPVAMSTDTYTVTPLFFPGGSIGTLAVHGTVNDVSMLGASPKYLTCAFVLEEGLDLDVLERVVSDMGGAARNAGVAIVTGDTKVVPRGACDKIFINTAGIGTIIRQPAPSGHSAKPGDAVLVSGAMGDHGLTVMALRDKLSFVSGVQSDSAPLNRLVEAVLNAVPEVHVFRDPTRGGLATTLNEIAQQSAVSILLNDEDIPVHENVAGGCSFLGIDPLYLANEGKCICILPEAYAEKALEVMTTFPCGREAARVGTVTDDRAGRVVLKTRIGGERFLGMLEGALLPRIC